MFYPVESLKRGGRFYMCWVADSWPLRFAQITHRQLWSQDIRKLCDDLMEVVNNESGRPINRFSLRLSSQLMRGLVRLYDRKVTIILSDLCMIHANVLKHTNKKFTVHKVTSHVQRPLPRVEEVVPAPPVNAQTVEEMLQNSGNVVANIQDITLKEAAIPEFQLPPNDGFGEEHPNQALHLLVDRTVEMMLLQPDTSAAHHSALDLPLDKSAERSHDKSRLVLPEQPQMEPIVEHDITLFRKSTAEGLQPPEDIEKDIPAIPDLPLPPAAAPEPEINPAPVPEPDKNFLEPMEVQEPLKDQAEPLKDQAEPPKDQAESPQKRPPGKEPEMELEALEEGQVVSRKRRARARPHLIIDKRIKLSGAFLRERIDNPNVELRCEDSSDDIVEVRVPWEHLARRPARAGFRNRTNMASALIRVYQMRLSCDRVPYELRLELKLAEMFNANASNASDINKSIEFLSEKYTELNVKIANLYKLVDFIWQKLNLGRVEQLCIIRREADNMRKLESQEPSRRCTRAALEKITEEEEPAPPIPAPVEQVVQIEQPITERDVTAVVDLNVTAPPDVTAELNVMAPRDVTAELNVTGPRDVTAELNMTGPRDVTAELNLTGPRDVTAELNVTGPRDVSGKLDVTGLREQPTVEPVEPVEQDIHVLPTQKLETLKRTSEYNISAKRRRLSGYMSFKDHHQQLQKEIPEPAGQEIDKENIPPEHEQSQRISQRNVTTLLQEAGLADMHPRPDTVEPQSVVEPPAVVEPQAAAETRRKGNSESSETPLGSLDRTKVSLGDSVKTTETQSFIRNQWGKEGTMIKILNCMKAGISPITVESLIEKGPIISRYKAIIAARCFISILYLKKHSFIRIVKDPDTLAISDIKLGTIFDGI